MSNNTIDKLKITVDTIPELLDKEVQLKQGDTMLVKFKDGLEKMLTEIIETNGGKIDTTLGLDQYGLLSPVLGEQTAHHHVFKDSDAVDVFPIKSEIPQLTRFIVNVKKDTEYHHVHAKMNDPVFRKENKIPDNVVMFDHYTVTNFLKEDLHAPHKVRKGLYMLTTQLESDIDGLLRPSLD